MLKEEKENKTNREKLLKKGISICDMGGWVGWSIPNMDLGRYYHYGSKTFTKIKQKRNTFGTSKEA